jgi:patatin-like phospholipase/acyl hydrolase
MAIPSNPSQRPFLILSLDGGGVRGLIPLTILREIETKTSKPTSQLFDLIVGNSTGGIIALCLAAQKEGNQPKYSAEDVLNLYYTGIPKIFRKSFFRPLYTGFGLWAPRYNRSNLESALQEFFGDLRLSQVASHALVTSYSLTKDSLSLWTSYRAKSDSNMNILLSDAAGATSAAPTYFAPKMLTLPDGTTSYEVDGGIYTNDPEAIAVTEALLQNPGLKPEQIFILSLGTGRPKLKQAGQQLSNKGIIGWLMQVNLIDLMLNADTQLGEFEVKSLSLLERHRIQFELESKNSGMDNVTSDNLKSLLQVGEDFIQKSQDEIIEICGFLMQNQPVALESVKSSK